MEGLPKGRPAPAFVPTIHCPQPDAIRGALAACRGWRNLPRGCITPARFATEVEPSQSAGALGLGQAARLPTQRAARLTGKQNAKVTGQKGFCPAPITAAAGAVGGDLPGRRV